MPENARKPTGVTLIGMPGAGKSTVGVMLAKRLALGFIDSDVEIQVRTGKSLQTILDKEGYLALREVEAKVLCELNATGRVIATGGSAVYSAAAMQHLSHNSTVVYLETTLDELVSRIDDFATRGIARRPDQSFESVFHERTQLYRRYAELTIDAGELPERVVHAIVQHLHQARR